MAPIVARVRLEADLPAAIAWGMGNPTVADTVIRTGQANLVKIGRALIAEPHWPFTAAQELGIAQPFWRTLPAPYAYWLERYTPIPAPVDAGPSSLSR